MAPTKRALWSENALQQAVNSVRNGMSVLRASQDYNIPRRTLRNHLLSGSTVKKLGRGSLLRKEQEEELCSRIFRLAEVGMPVTSRVLRRSVYTFVEENNIKHTFNKITRMAGRKWMHLFYQRHPEIAQRRVQILNPARAQKLNRFIVADYFTKLENVLVNLELMNKPQQIFNMDEKGCRLTIHHQQKVLSRRGVKRVHMIAQEHAENVTVVACGNALGQAIPPMILFKGKRKKDEWLDAMPPGTALEMTQKGSMTAVVFVTWMEHFVKYKPPGKCLLIFDGASSHLDANIVVAAEAHEVTLFCLPSNTTHELQPLDKSVFRSFEHYWDEEVLQFWVRNPERRITRLRFGELLSKVWPKAMSPTNLAAGFRATGIYPFNKDILPDSAYAPSAITEIPMQNHVTAEDTESDQEPKAEKKSKKQLDQESDTDSDACEPSLHDSSEDYDSDDKIPLAGLVRNQHFFISR